jgi:acylphosphatase
MTNDTYHLKVIITGKVQGVSFRSSARREAERLGLHGFARNESDGSVYIEAEGNHKQLQEFLEWCKEGSPAALVESVETSTHEPHGHQGFEKR